MGAGHIAGEIYVIDSNPELIFPALVKHPEHRVMGEVYRVSDEQLKELDAFEGISEVTDRPDEYRRVMVPVELETGDSMQAWVWEWNLPLGNALWLEHGDWLRYEPNPS